MAHRTDKEGREAHRTDVVRNRRRCKIVGDEKMQFSRASRNLSNDPTDADVHVAPCESHARRLSFHERVCHTLSREDENVTDLAS